MLACVGPIFFLILAIFLLILVWQCGRIQRIMRDGINLVRGGENILSFLCFASKEEHHCVDVEKDFLPLRGIFCEQLVADRSGRI